MSITTIPVHIAIIYAFQGYLLYKHLLRHTATNRGCGRNTDPAPPPNLIKQIKHLVATQEAQTKQNGIK